MIDSLSNSIAGKMDAVLAFEPDSWKDSETGLPKYLNSLPEKFVASLPEDYSDMVAALEPMIDPIAEKIGEIITDEYGIGSDEPVNISPEDALRDRYPNLAWVEDFKADGQDTSNWSKQDKARAALNDILHGVMDRALDHIKMVHPDDLRG